ncbi:alpha,alpha-trehalose-phosphate synthase (UDP-forming) [Halovivax limisalsi]|uniref:alpha,alpha-trehalose-phosphate synthase (UDP-forming) n=1 Tax=Halovivax limisalsi TaxID=1453760 RepID=UPI001FFD2912|nr:trehalose-6-phosphate synthase [Halovivax limisalsi]
MRTPDQAASSDRTRRTDAERRRALDALESFDSVVLVSNREPYRHRYDEQGTVTVDRPTGGLTSALDPVLQRVGGTWIAWGDGDADEDVVDEADCVSVPPSDPAYTLRRLWLDEDTVDGYYEGFANRVLWPLCHGFPEHVESRPGDYRDYRDVNRRFATCATDHAEANSLVWLQDYHLALAPAYIEETAPPGTTVGLFWHVPWPKPDEFGACPGAVELLDGLLGTDLLGFHVASFVENFFECVERFEPDASVDRDAGVVTLDGDRTRVLATPLGIDADDHARTARSLDSAGRRTVEYEELDRTPSDQVTVPNSITERSDDGADRERLSAHLAIPECDALCLGVDRLDYSKGILARVEAIERLLEREPGWRDSLVFVQSASPSRTNIPAYSEYGDAVRSAVDRVNDRFASGTWRPIVYTEDYLPRSALIELYRRADALVVSSKRDGMNLVAKEYVAASVDDSGALCLSEFAGATEQLGDLAYTIDPTDIDGMAATIDAALRADPDERRHRMRRMRRRVHDRSVDWWMASQFEALRDAHDRTRRSSSTPATGEP